MRVLDPGHHYELAQLDIDPDDYDDPVYLRFVKRVGDGYPGNTAPAYAGTNMQEVLRALIDRLGYVCNQAGALGDTASALTDFQCIEHLRDVLWLLEERAARRAGRPWPCVAIGDGEIESIPTCTGCGHIGCTGGCR